MKKIVIAIAGVGLLMVSALWVDEQLHRETVLVIRLLIHTLALSVTGVLVTGVWYFAASAREKVLERRALRQREQREIIANEHGVWIAESGKGGLSVRALHLDPRAHQNGRQSEPTGDEWQRWSLWTESRGKRPSAFKDTPLLPDTTPPVDLMAALDAVQRCLIVGASDSGKTTLLQHIIARRASRSEVIVIDPHASPQKWAAGNVVGIGRDYVKIDRALEALVRLMTKRYDEIGKGEVIEGRHKPLTIVIDEWRAIVANLGKPAQEAIKALLTESRKAAFSVFVASHSERVKPLGIEGEGDLKDGFTVVRLALVEGQRRATLDHGAGEVPATLPGAFVVHKPIVEGTAELLTAEDLEPGPTAEEARVLEMWEQGESYRTITTELWGQVGKFYNDKIDSIKAKYASEK